MMQVNIKGRNNKLKRRCVSTFAAKIDTRENLHKHSHMFVVQQVSAVDTALQYSIKHVNTLGRTQNTHVAKPGKKHRCTSCSCCPALARALMAWLLT